MPAFLEDGTVEAFFDALRRGQRGDAEALLDAHPAGAPPLRLAAQSGDFALVRALLDAGHRAPSGTTALLVARQEGHAALAELLRARGATEFES